MDDYEVIPRCERTKKCGYIVSFGNGVQVSMPDENLALMFYKGLKGRKSLSVADGGYLVPLLSDE